MTDMLIRNLDEESVRRIDAEAERQGLSRNEFMRREIERLAHRGERPATRADFERAAAALSDLLDDEVMRHAWS